MAKSTVLRLGFGDRLIELLSAGATIDEITDELNGVLEHAGRDDRVSRSAVGRAAKAHEGLLAAKRRQDLLVATLKERAPQADAREARLELLRTLMFDTASQALGAEDGLSPEQMRDLASGLLNLERTGQLADKRLVEAEARARAKAGEAGEHAARRQGLSAEGATAIRQAIEGAS